MTALLETTNSSCVNIDNGFVNGVVFIDLKKAFDTIDHKIIIKKLVHYGVDQSARRWFQSCLTNRNQKCYVNTSVNRLLSIVLVKVAHYATSIAHF